MLNGMKRTRGKFHPTVALAFGALCNTPEGDDGGGDAAATAAKVASDAANTAKTFTQDDVSRIAAAEAAKGQRAGAAAVATELGMSVADAKALIATAAAASEAAKSEAQKQADAAAKTTADGQAAIAAAAKTVLASKVTTALLIAGIAPQVDGKPNPALAMAARLVDVEAGADDAAITAAIDTVKAAAPAFFAATPAKADTDAGKPPKTRANGTVFGSAGAAEAAKRYPQKVAS